MAKTLYRAAADAQHPSGTNNLAYMHLLEGNYTEAIKGFHLAWALGSADAAFNIGNVFETGCADTDGSVIEPSTAMAVAWYRDAAEKVNM